MTNEEIIKALVLNNPDLVEELVRSQLEQHLEYVEKDMENIECGNPVNVFSFRPYLDYMLLDQRRKALEMALEYYTPPKD